MRSHDNDNVPDADILDGLFTPDEIARRITASSGEHITARTVWEKAKRIGVAKKIGRSMLVAASDIPALLREESKKWPQSSNEEKSTISPSTLTVIRKGEALALLRKNRRSNSRTKK